MIEWFLGLLESTPPGDWVVALLGVIALVETLFPPVPGDLLFVVTAGWARVGGSSAASMATAGFLGCMVSSVGLYVFGRTAGRAFTRGFLARRLGLQKVRRAEVLFRRHGPFALVASRFIPGVRSLLVVVAGASGMGPVRSTLAVSVSAAAWYALLTAAGVVAGDNMVTARAFLHSYERWIWLAAGLALLVYAGFHLARRRSG